MARAVLITGGNIAGVKERMHRAQELINSRAGVVMRCSHRYESKAWGFESDDLFNNQVLVVDTELSPEELLRTVQEIELELGRNRTAEAEQKASTGAAYCSRPIDIDILFYDDEVVDTPDLKIPHPLLHRRDFVLTPLCEIMRDFRHPVLGKTISELRAALAEEQK